MPEEAQGKSNNQPTPPGEPRLIKATRHWSAWWALVGAAIVIALGIVFWQWVDQLQNGGNPDSGPQTYRSQTDGFEITYPENADLLENGPEYLIQIPSTTEGVGVNISVIVYPTIGEKPLTDQVGETLVDEPSTLVWSEATIGGQPAMTTYWDTVPESGESHQVFVVEVNGRGYAVHKHVYDRPGSTEQEAAAGGVLSSLRFP